MRTITKTVKLLEPWNRHQKGAELDLPEPTADTLIRGKIAKACAPTKLSGAGTKAVSSTKTTKKAATV